MYNVIDYKETENYLVRLEEYDGHVFIHLTLHKASRTILDELLQIWAEIKALAYYNGYEEIYTYTQDERMFKFFPFSIDAGDMEVNGKKLKVAKWELN